MDNLINIHCSFVEYRLNDDKKWYTSTKCTQCVDSCFIKNMVNSKPYYLKLGGSMSIEMTNNRRFGVCISKIVSTSICGKVKRSYTFNYNHARYAD